MHNMKKKQEEEVASLTKEAYAMTIMKGNYEQVVSAHQSQPGNINQQVSEDVKFEVVSIFSSISMNILCIVIDIQWMHNVYYYTHSHCVLQFRAVMDSLFQSFEVSVSTNNFDDTSRTLIQWVEEHCKPQVRISELRIFCSILKPKSSILFISYLYYI